MAGGAAVRVAGGRGAVAAERQGGVEVDGGRVGAGARGSVVEAALVGGEGRHVFWGDEEGRGAPAQRPE